MSELTGCGAPIWFVRFLPASSAPVGSLSVNSGLAGFDLNGEEGAG